VVFLFFMAGEHVSTVNADLLAEQALIQAGKFQGRLLTEYNQYIFPGRGWRVPQSSAVTDFLSSAVNCGADNLEELLLGMHETNGQPVQWADMGGGRAMPMRQLANMAKFDNKLKLVNVDLFNYGLAGLSDEEIDYLEDISPGITECQQEPGFLMADAETVNLVEPANLITSVETLQYLNDPLAALCNWYNQLSDKGVLVAVTERDWSSWIRREGEVIEPEKRLTQEMLEELGRHGIEHAVSFELDYKNGFRPNTTHRIREIAIQKKAGTELKVNIPVTDIWLSPYDYKAVYYKPVDVPISVITT
jgi:hypothetical protein